jgi:hypothetical protein
VFTEGWILPPIERGVSVSEAEGCGPLPAFRQMNEFKVMKLLDHPNIAGLHAAFQDDTYIYFVLEPCMVCTHQPYSHKVSAS